MSFVLRLLPRSRFLCSLVFLYILSVSVVQLPCAASTTETTNVLSVTRDPDIGKRTPELIQSYGYPLETHTILTEDGYILQYFRIPYGKLSPASSNKPAVLLQHGLAASSVTWFFQNEDKTLPYMLVNQGFDVWLGNSRGTTYSNTHMTLNRTAPNYWKFSYEDMGKFDIPAAIDYILNVTSQARVHYIGHSQGTTQFFAMMALRPEYNAKIRLMSAFAPVAFVGGVKGSMRALRAIGAAWSFAGGNFITDLGYGEQVPELLQRVIQKYGPTVCEFEQSICDHIMFLTGQFDAPQTNRTRIPEIISGFPDAASVNCYAHYAQGVYSGKFARFNYGVIENLLKYGRLTPPEFNIGAITAPVALYSGLGDASADPQDVAALAGLLPNVVSNYSVPYSGFNHIDFVLAINASELVYQETIRLMKLY